MQKSKVFILFAVAVVAAVLVGGVIFFLSSKSNKAPQATMQGEEQVLTLSPEEIGLTLSGITAGRFADHGVLLKITKVSDIATIDWELSYTEEKGLNRGAIGHVDVKPSDSVYSQEIPFGTCSDFCHFDKGVKDVKIILKVTKKDGKIYSVQASYNP